MTKKIFSLIMIFSLIFTGLFSETDSHAASPKLNKSSLTLRVGRSATLKVYRTKKKITWRSTKKSVASVSQTGKVTAKKIGTAKICAKFSGRKLYCKVTVTRQAGDSKAGGKLNPLSAYDEHTIDYYDDGKKVGTFKIKLTKFLSGKSAASLVANNPDNPEPSDTQEYLYFQFQIKYLSGSEVVKAKDLFSYYYNIYDSTGANQIENIDWGFYFELMEDLSDVTLSPGASTKCAKAVLVNKGNTPVLYRIRTGRNSYTWFTTKK